MNDKIKFYALFLEAFIIEKDEFTQQGLDKRFNEMKQELINLTPRDASWEQTPKQIKKIVFLHRCFTCRWKALVGWVGENEHEQSMTGLKCLEETTKEQNIWHEVLSEVSSKFEKELEKYLKPQ